MKHSINVSVRVRPSSEEESGEMICQRGKYLDVHGVQFDFPSRVVLGSDQNSSFDLLAVDMVHKLESGFSCTLMAYGQTGSGKTYTMFGPAGCLTESELLRAQGIPSTFGIFPRVAIHLLSLPGCSLHASAIEIYQDEIFDLLNNGAPLSVSSSSSSAQCKPRVVVVGAEPGATLSKDGVHAASCTCRRCRTAKKKETAERISLIREKQANKATSSSKPLYGTADSNASYMSVGETLLPLASDLDVVRLARTIELSRTAHGHLLNDRSSRSHCIVKVYLKRTVDTRGSSIKQSFCFVDLAGSERILKSGVVGKRAQEAAEINLSLTVLGRVIQALARGRGNYVPYRDSTLTKILKSAFDGQHSYTSVVVNVSNDMVHLKETLSSLRFGSSLTTVSHVVVAQTGTSRTNNSDQRSALEERISSKRLQMEELRSHGQGGCFSQGAQSTEKSTFLKNVHMLEQIRKRISKLKVEAAEAGAGASERLVYQFQARLTAEKSKESNMLGIIQRQKTIKGFWVEPSKVFMHLEAEVKAAEGQLMFL